MVTFLNSLVLINIIVFAVEVHITASRYTKHNRLERKKTDNNNKPNIFVVLNGMTDNDVKTTLQNKKFKALLDRVDGIKSFKKNKKYNSKSFLANIPKDDSNSYASNSTSSSFSSENNDVKFSNENLNIKHHDPEVFNTDLFQSKYAAKKHGSWSQWAPTLLNYTKEIINDDENDVFDDENDVFDDENDSKHLKGILRLGGSCSKGAAKACSKACKSVLKGVCEEYKCSSGMKSKFKSECGKNCRTRFKTD